MMFDRFDICEAWFVWAHDWGQYDVITRLQRMGFRPGLSASNGRLDENAQSIYDAKAGDNYIVAKTPAAADLLKAAVLEVTGR